ncbi:variable large family protein, partial [Borreliella bissettiae]|uniref:variable large family protein n=1 Tax=Borrelia bissettiae TaxID=64897 RepID=UPI001E305547
AAFKNEMKKSDKIAAAIVLRGLAKDGKFAGAAGGNGNKEAIKSAVESAVGKVSKWLEEMIKAAGKAADEGKGDALKGVKEAGGGDNKEAGKLFAVGAGGVAAADDIKKAAAAVSAVSGEQIL